MSTEVAGEKKVTNYVTTLTGEEITALQDLLTRRGYEMQQQAYAHFKASGDRVNVVAYCSGKVTVQGANTADFVLYTLEPEILHRAEFGYERAGTGSAVETVEENIDFHGGIDESGKGDFFGPVVIAGVVVTPETGARLAQLGVRDSKLVKSSKTILELSRKIREIVGDSSTLVMLKPATYNRLYERIGNLNRLLAWGHARVIENLLEKVPDCPRMLSDQFGSSVLIKNALMTRGRNVCLDQETKAERDVAVAAASILAREGFLRGMECLSALAGRELPRGAGFGVEEAAREILSAQGTEIFREIAKLHFRTWQKLTGTEELNPLIHK